MPRHPDPVAAARARLDEFGHADSVAARAHAGSLLAAALEELLAFSEAQSRTNVDLTNRLDRARHDPLTGLPTRDLFEDRAHEYLRSGASTAAVFIDLNGLKPINDQHNHRMGDQALRATADRLRKWATETSACVARLGGDEFAAVVPWTASSDSDLRRLAVMLAEPVTVDTTVLNLSASIGSCLVEGNTPAALSKALHAADLRMLEAKGRYYDRRGRPVRADHRS